MEFSEYYIQFKYQIDFIMDKKEIYSLDTIIYLFGASKSMYYLIAIKWST